MWFTVIVVIALIGSVWVIAAESSRDEGFTQERVWYAIKKVILFVPYILIGIGLHVAGDFKNHRAGYIVLALVVVFLGWGMYMGLKAGPESPAPWQ